MVETAPAPRRPRHLMDPAHPQLPPTTRHVPVAQVQMWVMSVLAVTTIGHFAAGLFVAAMLYDHDRPSGRIGFTVLGALCCLGAVFAFRAIHQKKTVSPWLLVGLVPTVVAAWLTFGSGSPLS